MKAGQIFKCLSWVFLYSNLYLANASGDDDLMDFDFFDLKEIDWNYGNESTNGTMPTLKTSKSNDKWKVQEHSVTFDAKDDEDAENQVHPFDWREKMLRNALSKALTNKKLRQQFVEIMPILRALSRQQRLSLSAIVSAQVNARTGQQLRLEQVRMMFGDDKKLLIPIIYDIANLVSGSARKYLQYVHEVVPDTSHEKTLPQIERRNLDDVDPDESIDEDIGTLPSAAMLESSLEDFLDDVPDDVLDPQSINEELQVSSTKSTKSTQPETTTTNRAKRLRRDTNSFMPTDFVHKLIRSMPLTVNEEDLQQGAAGRTVQLNSTSFEAPGNEEETHAESVQDESKGKLSYQEIEDLAFASLNGTEISLTHSEMENEKNTTANEPLPNPEELIAGPRYRLGGNKVRLTRPKMPPLAAKRKRVQIPKAQTQRINGQATAGSSMVVGATSVPAPRRCERFTPSMCIRTEDYPLDQIMGSIRRHKNAMTALLAEYPDKPIPVDLSDDISDFALNQRRREDEAAAESGGSMCQSIVRYARPQKARSASGEWKYIVNTGQHTQTLRLEKCSHPQESCSYLAQSYRSHCAQVYNYHRLLSWDKTRGLHVDIYKVPTCCSCQVDGYRPQFPPLDAIKIKDYTPSYNPESYSTIHEELDYNDNEDEEDATYQMSNKYNQHKRGSSSSSSSSSSNHHSFDVNELQLGSKNVRIKTNPPNPTMGSYLTPPGSNEYDTNYAYQSGHHYHRQPSSSASPSRHIYSQSERDRERRRPYKSLNHGYDSESFGDLEFSPSEKYMDKEVNIFGSNHANEKTRQVQPKRKHIYSVPHTVASTSSTGSSSSHSTASLSSTFTPILEPGQRNGHGIEYKHEEHGQVLSRSSSTAAITHQTAATVPSYYVPKFNKQHAQGGRSKIQFTTPTTPPSQPQTAAASASASASSPTKSHESAHAAETPSPTNHAVYRQSVASIQSGYPPLYHIGTVFNNSHGHDSSVSGASKRINYSYHPIIDFFESNSQRFLSPSATLSNPSPVLPTATTYDESSSSSSSSFMGPTHSSPHTKLFPHKIPKYSSVSLGNIAADLQVQAGEAKNNALSQHRERRIGVGVGGGGGGDVGGGGVAVGIGKFSGNGKQNQLVSANIENNVWQPVLVK